MAMTSTAGSLKAITSTAGSGEGYSKGLIVGAIGALVIIALVASGAMFTSSIQIVSVETEAPTPPPAPVARRWGDVARKTRTDKVAPRTHNYGPLYERYLSPFLKKGEIKLLEVGLGCGMQYGPGESLKIWRDYFKDIKLDLHFLEYNKECMDKWKGEFPDITFHTGDQADPKVHQKILKDSGGGNFDVVIDDGGHMMHQQLATFDFWLRTPGAIKEGGIFILEDLQTSYFPQYGATPGKETMVGRISNLFKDMTRAVDGGLKKQKPHLGNLRELVGHIDCYLEACVFEKNTWRPIYEARKIN